MDFPLFLIPILVGLAAQATKMVVNRREWSSDSGRDELLPRYGGMPSAHTAFIFSLITVVGFFDGIFSTSFAIAATLVLLIIDDAMRMRMFLGRYGAALRLLVARLPKKDQQEYPYIEARLGHRAIEVVVGAFYGVIATLLVLLALGML